MRRVPDKSGLPSRTKPGANNDYPNMAIPDQQQQQIIADNQKKQVKKKVNTAQGAKNPTAQGGAANGYHHLATNTGSTGGSSSAMEYAWLEPKHDPIATDTNLAEIDFEDFRNEDLAYAFSCGVSGINATVAGQNFNFMKYEKAFPEFISLFWLQIYA